MRTRRPSTIWTSACLIGCTLLSGARTAAAQEPPSAPPSPAPSPEAFQPTESPLVVPSAPPPSVLGPQAAPRYPTGYAPPGSYGSYPAAPGYPYAQPAEARPRAGAFEHDGFFLRLNLGVGAGGMAYDERGVGGGSASVKTRGVVGVFEVAVGGRVVENLIVHGTLIAAGMSSTKSIDGVENRTYDDLATRMVLLGGGLTYYVMPTNLFLTAVVGGTYLEEEREDQRAGRDERTRIESGAGVGVALSVGKEWWVGQRGQWAIGAAITGAFYTAPIETVSEETWAKAHSISLSFSATYN
ncbi:MAG: hypothetical protein ABW252_26330 [Polyangiales bacterium]